MPEKKRLDIVMVDQGLAPSRQRAKALIMAGKVLMDTQRMDKPGALVPADIVLSVKDNDPPFVSRGGLKLQAALASLNLSVAQLVCMDVGASTGGFTDCLLQRGAARVYAVDVGYGQLAWQLRQDTRVVVMERTNIRHMTEEQMPEQVDLVTIDTAFISLKIVVPAVLKFLKPQGRILALIKPQFEAGKGRVGKGGVVRDVQQQAQIIQTLVCFFEAMHLTCGPVVPSPILGPKGNQEFIIVLHPFDSFI
ncbi:MAG: TlyA family RNA methyltransferase [Desulfatitalea sp.]|nr:TlyA family RNA methyltransferase [Desulfatitalea sp.]NNJ99443.1 TlyA family RNA methyltransferase [Desulfatitalea sp.]